jgi:hypothetical protein
MKCLMGAHSVCATAFLVPSRSGRSADARTSTPPPPFRPASAFKEQGRAIYRTGSIDACERQSDDFTWCWQTMSKLSEPERKREAWVRRRAEWWTSRRLSESSEDIWDVRGCVSLVLVLFPDSFTSCMSC